MKEQIILIGLLSLLWSCKSIKNTSDKSVVLEQRETVSSTASDSLSFPMSWIGHYKGQLNIYPDNKNVSSFEMALRIGAADLSGHYPWTLIYNNEDVRAYGLIELDKEQGLYKIDEYNSIRLEAYYKGDHFISKFNVMGSDLLVDYEKIGEDIRIRFYISSDKSVSQSGGEVFATDTVPTVKAFPILVFQEALLKKVK